MKTVDKSTTFRLAQAAKAEGQMIHGLKTPYGGVRKIGGPFLQVLIIRIIAYRGPSRGPLFLETSIKGYMGS